MSSIGSISSSTTTQTIHASSRRRPDPAEMAEKLFSQLDASGQGYISKSDLESAMSKVGSSSGTSSASDLFSTLDADGDGKVTKDEFSSALQAAAQQLDSQFDQMRMQGGMQGAGGHPPPPPPEGDSGFTKDELQQQLSEIGSSDSKRSALLEKITANFDKADTDGDGKVSFKEAMAYDQGATSSSGTTTSATTSGTAASSGTSTATAAATDDTSMRLMMQIMRLMQAYNIENGDDNSLTAISASA